jgi:FO synthase
MAMRRSGMGALIGRRVKVLITTERMTQSGPGLAAVIESARDGRALSEVDAQALAGAGVSDLPELCAAAAESRDKVKGRTVTFSPKVFIPLTRLCRDFCGYCTFRQDPTQAANLFMTPEEILGVARAGQDLGCTEALFTLGERPEQRYPEAKAWLVDRGYDSTLGYLADMCRLVVEETSMTPHANPGTMSRREMAALRPFNPSMGLMLESTSPRLYGPGGPHESAPSKRPRVRLRTLEIAGELEVPFTTGILVGIGETRLESIDALLAIRGLHQRFGHVQEVIIQNFLAKPDTMMAGVAAPSSDEFRWTVAAARLILGADMNLQVPPNLNARDYQVYLDAGINDWGGVSPLTIDYVNPEAPWPGLRELRDRSAEMGFELKPRLPVYPEFLGFGADHLSTGLRQTLSSLIDDDGYVTGGIGRYAGTRNGNHPC